MKASIRFLAAAAAVFAATLSGASPSPTQSLGPTPTRQGGLDLARLPLVFEKNEGQFAEPVKFAVRGSAGAIWMTESGATFLVQESSSSKGRSATVEMALEGRARGIKPEGLDRVEQITNHFIGNDPKRHFTNIPNFKRIVYRSVYPGVDVVYYGNQRELEYDFIVQPRADVRRIGLKFKGAALKLSPVGDLLLKTAAGEVTLKKPVAYQEINGERVGVEASYVLKEGRRVGFQIAKYDQGLPLVIDPILSYSTYLGGSGEDVVRGIDVDAAGNAYVTGYTTSSDFPAVNGYKTRLSGTQEAFVAKLNATGTGLIYSTFLGANRSSSQGATIRVDAAGNAVVAGTTNSTAFPVTAGAYQTTAAGSNLSFVTKLNAAGNALVYSTYLNYSTIRSLALDASGRAHVAGSAYPGFVTTPGAFQTENRNWITSDTPFVAKLEATGGSLAYATYVGGSSKDVAKGIDVDQAGNAYIVGTAESSDFPLVNAFRSTYSGGKDAFVAKVSADGAALVYSTYLGGSDREEGNAIAVDPMGQAHVVGYTRSGNFPTASAFQNLLGNSQVANAFIAKLTASGNGLVYSTFLGGAGCLRPGVSSCTGDAPAEQATGVATDAMGATYVVGVSQSAVFPSVSPLYSETGDGTREALFVAKVRPNGTREYSSILGKRDYSVTDYLFAPAIATDSTGAAYIGGWATPTAPFPITGGAYQTGPKTTSTAYPNDVVVFKLSLGQDAVVLSGDKAKLAGQLVNLVAYSDSPQAADIVVWSTSLSADHTPQSVVGTAPLSEGRAALVVSLPAGIHRLQAQNTADGTWSRPFYVTVNLP